MPALDDLNGIYIGSEEIQSVYLGSQEIWSSKPKKYLTFTSAGGNTLSMYNHNGNAPIIYHSTNLTDWYLWDYDALSIADGQSIYICGINENGISSELKYSKFVISGSGTIACSGSIMSLINPYHDVLTIPHTYCYYRMFENCSSLTTAPILMATTLAEFCYYRMFSNCTSLTVAPELPATTLARGCYSNIFLNCTSLATAPELPATVLADSCYGSMFSGCTSLITAPELLATTLANYCYRFMFQGCTSLITAPELPATSLADSCYYYTFYGTNVLPDCTNIDFTSNGVLSSGGLKGLFGGTKVTNSDLNRILPKNTNNKYYLPATTLANDCYREMFAWCTDLTTAPELPATTLATNCYSSMFINCTSLIIAPELPATTLISNCYSNMFYGCTSLNYVKCLATDISASYCLDRWLQGVSATGTFIKDPNMVAWPSGVSGIPSGWTVLRDGYTGNWIKLDRNRLNSSISGGSILDISNDYDTTNYSSNPPTIYLSDGSTIENITIIWQNATQIVLTSGNNLYGTIEFNSATAPTTYTYTKAPGW